MPLDITSVDALVHAYEDRFGRNGPLSARIPALRKAKSVNDLTPDDRELMRVAAHDLLARGNGEGAARPSLWSAGSGRSAPDHELALALTTHQLSWLQYQEYLEALFVSPELYLQTYFDNIYNHPRHPYAQTRAASHEYWQAAWREPAENQNHERLCTVYEKFFAGDWVAVRAEIAAIIDEKIFFYGPEEYWFEFLIDTVELKSRLQSPDLSPRSRRALELMLVLRLQTFHRDIFREDLFSEAGGSLDSRLAKKVFGEYDHLFAEVLSCVIKGDFANIKFDWGPFFWRHRDFIEQPIEDPAHTYRVHIANYLMHRWGDGKPYIVGTKPPFDSAQKKLRFARHRFFYHALGLIPTSLLVRLQSEYAPPAPLPFGETDMAPGRSPKYSALQAKLAANSKPLAFFDFIRERSGFPKIDWASQPNVVLVGRQSYDPATPVVNRLMLLTEAELAHQEIPDDPYFGIYWNWHAGEIYIDHASGRGWPGLAEAYLWSRLPASFDHAVERALILPTLTFSAPGPIGIGLTWSKLVQYLSRDEDVISRLWSLKRIVDPTLPARPAKLVLVATANNSGAGSVSLRLVTKAEARSYDQSYMQLTYAWEGKEFFIDDAYGRHAVEAALEIFKHKHNKGEAVKNPVERAILVSRWSGDNQWRENPELQLTWASLITYLQISGEHPIRKLWALEVRQNPSLKKHPKGDFVMVGKKGFNAEVIHMSGLRLLMADEYDGHRTSGFGVVFGRHGNDVFVRKAEGLGAMEIGLTLLYARNANLSPLQLMEQAYVASLWEFRERKMDPEKTITWEKYENYFAHHAGDPIAHLWDILRQANPTLEERPHQLILMGTTRGSRPDTPVHANTLSMPDEADRKRLGDRMYFKVGFTWNGESYVATSDAGSNAKKVRQLFKSAKIANSPQPPLSLRGGNMGNDVVVGEGGEVIIADEVVTGLETTVDAAHGAPLIVPSVDHEPSSTVDEPLSTDVEGESGLSATPLVPPVAARSVTVVKLVVR